MVALLTEAISDIQIVFGEASTGALKYDCAQMLVFTACSIHRRITPGFHGQPEHREREVVERLEY